MMVLKINPIPLDYQRADHILEGLSNVSDPLERRQLVVGCLSLIREIDRNPLKRWWRWLKVNW